MSISENERYWQQRAQRAEAVLWYVLEWIGDGAIPHDMMQKAWSVAQGNPESTKHEGNSWRVMTDPVVMGVDLAKGRDRTVHHASEIEKDEAAVDRFSEAMKAKLAKAREKGYGGWDSPEQCDGLYLAQMLIEHLRKGNEGTFEDVANFAMMLHQRGETPETLERAWLEAEKDASDRGYRYATKAATPHTREQAHGDALAAWLVDAVATASQHPALNESSFHYDRVLAEAIFNNGKALASAPAGISVSRIGAMRVCEWEMRDAARKRGEVALAQAHSDRAQVLTELLAAASQRGGEK